MKWQLTITADLSQLEQVSDIIESMLVNADDLSDDIYNIQLAVHECCTNIVTHAYGGEPGNIDLTFDLTPEKYTIEICDSGQSFELDKVQSPDLENGQIHGYGIFLINQLMDEVAYRPGSPRNCWNLVRNRCYATI